MKAGGNVCDGEAARGLRVGLYSDSEAYAGTEAHLVELDAALRELGAQVWVICPIPSPLAEQVCRRGGHAVALQSKGWRALGALWQLARWMRGGSIRILHAHNGWTALLATLAASLCGRGTVVVSQHFIHPARTGRRGLAGRLAGWVHAGVRRRVSAWVAVSEAVRRSMVERGEADGRVECVPNGIAACTATPRPSESGLPEAMPLQREVRRVVCAARLAPEKDVSTLLNALALLRREGLRFELKVLGDGPLRGALWRRVLELQLQGEVEFLGHQPGVAAWIGEADLLVLPSPEEPFGLVLLEAMSLAKPVIAARGGGPQEIVLDGQTGLLFEPRDPRDLAMKLRVLLERPFLGEWMGACGWERWRHHYTRRKMAERMAALYTRALSGKPSGAGGEGKRREAAAPVGRD
ncbi:MAG: hypothetical protein RLZZ142_289 [Verrucomicrobiota bacterium]